MRAATIRGLSRSPTAGVFSEVNEAFTPRSLPNLAAWFDALDTRTMLSSDGSTITDGGAVALWGDKSGNSGVSALVLPAVSANYAYIPHDAGWGLSGTAIWDVDGYYNILAAPAATQCLWAKRLATGNQRAVNCGLNADGTIGLTWSSSGAGDAGTFTSTAAISFPFSGYIRAAFNPNNGSNAVVDFYTSTNGTTWSALGAQRSAVTGTVFASTATFEIGSFNSGTSQNLAAIVYRTRVYKGLRDSGGTLLADIDFSTAGKKLANGNTFTCATGQTVTLNSSGATGARIAGERDLFQGTLANRPVYLNYAGVKYGYLNAVSGNYFSSPESTVLDDATEFQVTVLFSPNALGISSILWAKAQGAEYTGYLLIDSNNDIALVLSTDGTAGGCVTVTKTPNVAFSVGTQRYIRATWRASDGRVQIFDGATIAGLRQAGTNGTISMDNLYNAKVPFEVGARAAGTANQANARIYSCEVCATIGGAAVQSFNPALYTSGTTFTASTGEVWTINGGAHIVTRSCNYGDGVNDSLKSAAYNCPQPTTIYWVGTMESWTASDYLFDGNGTNGGALVQTTSTPQVNLNAGSSVAGNTSAPLKTWGVFCAVLNGASSTLRWMRLAATTGDAGAGNMNGLTLLARGAANAGWFNGVVGEVAQYAGAHDTSIQARWALYAGRRHRFAA